MIRQAAYLAGQQNDDGGWPYQKGGDFGSESDVNSTAYVVQAFLALKNTALAEAGQNFIANLQNASGAFPYQKSQPDDNAGATYQAITALLGATFLEPKVARLARHPLQPLSQYPPPCLSRQVCP